ncbi:hypothetical protein, conserved [Entamoeba dispar SAW760]|uniref:Calpastatin n=1 Tax=Entamoeba dispar (strain ATCC PRA-260 / SAW760) TaxID=370354 RepID=B0EK38_ENTDS|nr:uncharacterized protein EDI_110580 [Entamoeba dispar SAW760]EDR25106.1 hypothetical protein, conserved [Entamoeba dispar SAW760]|eukprot:EDR25106.1 hypothetical protein, conserved [Entamoeba dispar SAW760]
MSNQITDDPFNLQRFIDGQETGITPRYHAQTYSTALEEVKNGKKVTHWIWYVFPVIQGLWGGRNNDLYNIRTLDEAKAYLNHPILSTRLRDITTTLLNQKNTLSPLNIFGSTDVHKVLSCMTLFYYISKDKLFKDIVDRYYKGNFHQETLTILKCLSTS